MLTLEYWIIVPVILYQLWYSLGLGRKISEFRGIFRYKFVVKWATVQEVRERQLASGSLYDSHDFPDDESLLVVVTKNDNQAATRMCKSINSYLVNNKGNEVNFGIIQDIIDRETDTKDEEISQALPTPLYLGLAATMSGIIFGLFSMSGESNTTFSEQIQPLIDGIKIAMGASLAGLLCTTVLSSFVYKKAKTTVLQQKSEQLSHLQAYLLPALMKTDDTGIAGLTRSLNRFSGKTDKLISNLGSIATNVEDNITGLNNLISRFAQIDMLQIARTNMAMFEKLERNLDTFNNFSSYIQIMGDIAANLKEFAQRTANIDNMGKVIQLTLEKSEALFEYLSAHLEELKSHGNMSLKAVDLSDSHFREAIEKLGVETNKRITALSNQANEQQVHLQNTYDKIGSVLKHIYEEVKAELHTVTSEHIQQFKESYKEAVPRFEQLTHLEGMACSEKEMEQKMGALLTCQENTNNELSTVISEMKENQQQVGQKLDNLLKTLSSKKQAATNDKTRINGSPKRKNHGLMKLITIAFPWNNRQKQKSGRTNNQVNAPTLVNNEKE